MRPRLACAAFAMHASPGSRHANRRFADMRYVTVSACLLLGHGAGVVSLSHMEGEKRHKHGRGDVHAHAVPGNRYRMATPGNAPQASAGGVTPAVAGRLEIPIPASRGYLSFPKLGQVSGVAPTATGRGGFGPLVLIQAGSAQALLAREKRLGRQPGRRARQDVGAREFWRQCTRLHGNYHGRALFEFRSC